MNTIVETVNSAGTLFIDSAAAMLIQSSVLIVIVFLADMVLRRRVRAVFRYCIWMLVLVKLILPTWLASPLSVGYWVGDGLEYLTEASAAGQAAEGPTAVEPEPLIMPQILNFEAVEAPRYAPVAASAIPGGEPVIEEPVPPVTQVRWEAVVFLAWLGIAAAMGLFVLQRVVIVRRLVRRAGPAGEQMQKVLADCRQMLGVEKKVRLRVCANVTSPAVCGLVRPVILVPRSLGRNLGAGELRGVLLHELAHIKRADLWVNLAQTILQIVYFYNPLLWLANAMIRRVREKAVDETVLVAMGEKAKWYPETLVSVAKLAFRRPVSGLRLIGVVESKGALAGRVRHILSRPLPTTAKMGVFGLGCVIVAGVLLLPMASRVESAELSEFAATLGDGVEVELVGVCEHPSAGRKWWRPDGRMLSRAPYQTMGVRNNGGGAIEFVVRTTGIKTEDAHCEWRIRPSVSLVQGDHPKDKGAKEIAELWAVAAKVPQGEESTDVRFSLAAGPWQTKATCDSKGAVTVVLEDSAEVSFATPKSMAGSGCEVVVSDSLKGRQHRLVAIDMNGKGHTAVRREVSYNGGMRRSTFVFSGLPVEKVSEFQFQARAYGHVEFRNVSLKPRHRTDVQVVVEHDEPRFVGRFANGVAIELVGLRDSRAAAVSPWWGPDGLRLGRPAHNKDFGPYVPSDGSFNPEKMCEREIVFRLLEAPDDPVAIAFECDLGRRWSGRVIDYRHNLIESDGSEQLRSESLVLPKGQRKAGIRIGIAMRDGEAAGGQAEREYAWIEFKNVSLQPGVRTEVGVKVEDSQRAWAQRAKAQGSSEYASWPVKLLSMRKNEVVSVHRWRIERDVERAIQFGWFREDADGVSEYAGEAAQGTGPVYLTLTVQKSDGFVTLRQRCSGGEGAESVRKEARIELPGGCELKQSYLSEPVTLTSARNQTLWSGNISRVHEHGTQRESRVWFVVRALEVGESVGTFKPPFDPVRIAPDCPFVVTGRVTDRQGRPMYGVTVRAATGWATLLGGGETVTDANGRYRLRFGPGRRTKIEETDKWGVGFQAASVSAFRDGYYEAGLCRDGNLSMAGSAEQINEEMIKNFKGVVLAGEPYEVNFVMLPAASVKGELVDVTGKGLGGVNLWLDGDELYPSSSVFANIEIDENGTFTVENVPCKSFWFTRRYGGEELRTEAVEFSEPGQYTVRLIWDGSGAGRLNLDCAELAGAEVMKEPDTADAGPAEIMPPKEIVENSAEGASPSSGAVVVLAGYKRAEYESIQDAVDAAPEGATIRIGPGVYKEHVEITKSLTLEGAGWDKTTILSQTSPVEDMRKMRLEAMERMRQAGSEKAAREISEKLEAEIRDRLASSGAMLVRGAEEVVIRSLKLMQAGERVEGSLIPTAVLTFDKAAAEVVGCVVSGGPGNGIHVKDGSDVEIRRSLVAAVWSTGIVIGDKNGEGCKTRIVDSDVRNCHYAAVAIGPNNKDVTVERCRISGAAWHGIRYDDASPNIVGNVIFENARSGIYASGTTAATVKGNVFYGNEQCGMSCWFQNRDVIEGNTFAGNKHLGLSVLGASKPAVCKNIFFDSPTGVYRGDIGSDLPSAKSDGEVKLEKNIFRDNEKKAVWRRVAAEGQESVMEDIAVGEDNLEVDPMFADAEGKDFSLRADSPASKQGIGVSEPVGFDSPWALLPEEKAIIPQGRTRDWRQWKKPEESAKTSGTNRKDEPEFGPVTEIVVVRNDTKPNLFIDLDTGRSFVPGEVWVEAKEPEQAMAAAKEKGVDVGVTVGSGDNLFFVGAVESVLSRSAGTDWDKTTATEVLGDEGLLEDEPGFGNITKTKEQLPAVYMYKTREGGMGLFQIVGFVDEPYGVKVRFKVVEGTAGQRTGLSWVVSDRSGSSGEKDYALCFDGAGSYVKIPNSVSLDIRGSLTVSAWVKSGERNGQIVWRGDNQSGRDPYELHLIGGLMEFRIDAGGGGSYRVRSGQAVDDKWHFWAGVYDSEAGELRLYKDGASIDSAGIKEEIEYDTSSMWNMIGAADFGNWQHFKGVLDEVRIWDAARTAEQITEDMQKASVAGEPNLVGYWTFDEGSGEVLRDTSGSHNDGSLGVWTGRRGYISPGRVGRQLKQDTEAGERAATTSTETNEQGQANEAVDVSSTIKSTEPEVNEQQGRIRGVVVSAVTGEPVAGAYVGVGDFGDSGGSNYTRHREQGLFGKAETDEQGRFELDGLCFTDEHTYLEYHPLVVTHQDFVRHDEKVELLKDKAVPDVKVSLRPAARIDVAVVDEEDRPVKGYWLLRLERLDGRRFIAAGRDPHLSSFASSVWLQWPQLRQDLDGSEGFSFTELDEGEYSVEAIRIFLSDPPTKTKVWEYFATYHGRVPDVRLRAAERRELQIRPADYGTSLEIRIPESPFARADIPSLLTISRNVGLLLWDSEKAYGLEDPRLGRLQKQAMFFTVGPPEGVFTIRNLPPGSYSVFAGPVVCMSGAKAEIETGRQTTLEIPEIEFDGTVSKVSPRRFDRKVQFEAKRYTAADICGLLSEETEFDPRIVADPAIEKQTIVFRQAEMSIWDVLERLYLSRGWRLTEGGEKELLLRPGPAR